MICDTILWEVVRADFFTAVAGADLAATRVIDFLGVFFLLQFVTNVTARLSSPLPYFCVGIFHLGTTRPCR